jgi:hypothetical protein
VSLNLAGISDGVSINTWLQPGDGGKAGQNHFNGFSRAGKPFKRLTAGAPAPPG